MAKLTYVPPHKNLHIDVIRSFIKNCQSLQDVLLLGESIESINVVHSEHGILFSTKKKWVKSWIDIEEP